MSFKEQQPSECYSRKPTWFERATTSRMLQSQTYVVRKSNNLQNVAVANLRVLQLETFVAQKSDV